MKVVIWDLCFMEYKKVHWLSCSKTIENTLKYLVFFLLFISRKSQSSVVLPRGSWKELFSSLFLQQASCLNHVGEHDFWCIAGTKMAAGCLPTGLRSNNERCYPTVKKQLHYVSIAATSCISTHGLASGFEAMIRSYFLRHRTSLSNLWV